MKKRLAFPITGLELALSQRLRNPGGLSIAKNVTAVPIGASDGWLPGWKHLKSPSSARGITGLNDTEFFIDIYPQVRSSIGPFGSAQGKLFRYLAATNMRLGILTPNNATPPVYSFSPIMNLNLTFPGYDGGSRIVWASMGSRQILSLFSSSRELLGTVWVVDDVAFTLPIPYPSRNEIALSSASGSLPSGVYAVRVAWRLWDGSLGPWSIPVPIDIGASSGGVQAVVSLISSKTWGERTVDSQVVNAIRGVVMALSPRLADSGTSLNSLRQKWLNSDYYVVAEKSIDFSLSVPQATATFGVEGYENYAPLAEDSGIHHGISGIPFVYNQRLWLGAVVTDFRKPIIADQVVGASGGGTSCDNSVLPGSVQNFTASRVSSYEVRLQWQAPYNYPGVCIDYYMIYRDQLDGIPNRSEAVFLNYAPGSATSYSDYTVQPGISYAYWIHAVNASGNGPESGPQTA